MVSTAIIRLKYGFLLFLAVMLSLAATLKFDMSSTHQAKISKEFGVFIVQILSIRIINYLFVISTFFMLIGIFLPRPNYPVFPFAWSMLTLILSLLATFIVYEIRKGGNRYETEVLTKFSLNTMQSRKFVFQQLQFLDKFQKSHNCCGLNDYDDYNKNSNKFTLNTAENDEPDQISHQRNNTILWKDFITENTMVNYSFYYCGKITTHAYEFENEKYRLGLNDDVPKSCCKFSNDTVCNQKVFGSIHNTSKIYTEGCSKHLLQFMQQVNTPLNIAILLCYPWIVFIYTFIVTWAYRCALLELSLTFCGPVGDKTEKDTMALRNIDETKETQRAGVFAQLGQKSSKRAASTVGDVAIKLTTTLRSLSLSNNRKTTPA